jgi:hypothetical protein
MIIAEEGKSSLGPCYIPSYKLSDEALLREYAHNCSAAKYFWNLTTITTESGSTKTVDFFHGNTLLNWAIFVKPRHPFVLQILTNIVEIMKAEYSRKSVLAMSAWDHKWKVFFCTTTFVMTYTLREMLLANSLSEENIPRIEGHDFSRYGGKCKYYSTGRDQSHYSKVSSFLAPVSLTTVLYDDVGCLLGNER